MAEVIAIAGIVVPAVVAFVAPTFVEFVKSKLNERKESLADIHEVLGKGLEELRAFQEDKETEVSSNYEQKDPSKLYETWKKRVSKIQGEVIPLNIEYDKVKEKKRSLWNKLSLRNNPRSQVEEKIKRALKEVIELLGKCPQNVLVDKLSDPVIKEIEVPQIAEYPTLQNVFQEIIDRLKIKGLKCVALYGQKGVGKTTIMQHLNNYHFNHNYMKFGMVIFIKVTAAAQTDAQTEESHILQKITKRIMVGGEGDELARKIQRVLENKIYLLILDGVRHALALNGIWEKLDISSHKSDSKVVISTLYPPALRSKYVNDTVNLKMLSRVEAWYMFRSIVGQNNLPYIPNAQLICERFCFCLPLLIGPIAKSFSSEAPPDLETKLNEWMHYWPEYGVDDLDGLFSILKKCYDQLRDPRGKKFFLYAALYPANSKISTDYFVECCIAQGFLDDVRAVTNYRELRSQGIKKTLTHLVNVAFLEGSGEEMRYVKMNDFYRQLALHISSQDPNPECKIYVDHEQHVEDFRSTSWERSRWVSMIDSKRDNLPANPNFMSLQTLLLENSLRLVEIPPTYFCSMANLRVLNLNGTRITTLPFLTDLTSLKAFYLNGCSDLIISSYDEIQPLENLEVFDSRGTRVNFVPCSKHLRCLRISYSPSCNYNEISRLHDLEELIIEVKKQFRLQWDNIARDIRQNAQRNINFIWKYV